MISTTLRPEAELLLACSRTHIEAGLADRIRALVQRNPDWDYLLAVASRHKVLPLLYYSLKRVCAQAVPLSTMRELRARFQANAEQNFSYVRGLFKVLDLLESKGVPSVPFKGPILAVVAYGNLALREFVDLDVLIKKEDLQKCRRLLFACGYRFWRELTPVQETLYLRSNHAYTFIGSNNDPNVDLHWKVAQSRYAFDLSPELLWERLERVSLGGRDVASLNAEDLLLILCLHGSKHCWERLAWVCDVAELLRAHQRLNWDRIVDQASRWNSERVLFSGLALARDLLDAPVPEEVLVKVGADPGVKVVSSHVKKRLLSGNNEPLGPIERTALYLKMRERLRYKIPYLLYRFRMAFTPNERDLQLLPSLPPFLYFLYYPLRLVRLAATYGRYAVSRPRRAN